ncbi:hypothetical protein [Pseudonocardia spinosispora]|uniref:hypothetical protein n=1 Tax=Pseudonocardia spinosispora TaxID=103441 RepID=UPI0004249EB7|nr:hypothetical protein [Pseudonocardia spinosispora]
MGVLVGAALLCGGLPTLVAALVLFGVGNSVLDVSMNAHAARVERVYQRPIFAGFHAFWNIGGLLGSGLSALLAAREVPIQVHFSLAGCGLLLAALAAAIGCFLTGAVPGQGGAALVVPSRALLALGVIAFCGFLVGGTINDWSALLLVGNGADATIASLGYFAFSLTMIAVRLVADSSGFARGSFYYGLDRGR